MSYTPTQWQSGDVITSAKLNNMETGIDATSNSCKQLTNVMQDCIGMVDMEFLPGYWNTKTIGNIVNPQQRIQNNDYVSAIAPFEKGDFCTLNADGGTSTTTMAYLDENYSVIQKTAIDSPYENVQAPIAPADTKYIVVQNALKKKPNGYYARLGKYPKLEIAGLSDALNLLNAGEIEDGYIDENGEVAYNASWKTVDKIHVKGVKKLILSGVWAALYLGGLNNVWCYDGNGDSLGGCFEAPTARIPSVYHVNLLPGTEYVSICNNKAIIENNQAAAIPVSIIDMIHNLIADAR